MGALRVITFKIDEELLEKLDTFARLENKTRSEVIRKAIELYLKLNTSKHNFKVRRVKLWS